MGLLTLSNVALFDRIYRAQMEVARKDSGAISSAFAYSISLLWHVRVHLPVRESYENVEILQRGQYEASFNRFSTCTTRCLWFSSYRRLSCLQQLLFVN